MLALPPCRALRRRSLFTLRVEETMVQTASRITRLRAVTMARSRKCSLALMMLLLMASGLM